MSIIKPEYGEYLDPKMSRYLAKLLEILKPEHRAEYSKYITSGGNQSDWLINFSMSADGIKLWNEHLIRFKKENVNDEIIDNEASNLDAEFKAEFKKLFGIEVLEALEEIKSGHAPKLKIKAGKIGKYEFFKIFEINDKYCVVSNTKHFFGLFNNYESAELKIRDINKKRALLDDEMYTPGENWSGMD